MATRKHKGSQPTSRGLNQMLQRFESRAKVRLERDSIFNRNKPMQDIYTDGSCPPKGGVGGWAFCVVRNNKAIHTTHDGLRNTTINRTELTAILEGMRWAVAQSPIRSTHIFSDSQNSVTAINDWMWDWEMAGWRAFYSTKQIAMSMRNFIKNRDLFESIMALLRQYPGIFSLSWVKGHSGIRWNELADQLASGATRDMRMRIIMEGVSDSRDSQGDPTSETG